MIYDMTYLGQGHDLTSGQNIDLTEIGHVAYHSKRLDETNTMALVSARYRNPFKSYQRNNFLRFLALLNSVTSGDLTVDLTSNLKTLLV